MAEINEFIVKELIHYIEQEMNKGYSLAQIRNALLSGGHHNDLVEDVIGHVQKHNFNFKSALAEPVKFKALKRELYYDVLNALIKYIEHHLAEGFTLTEIRKTLKDYGHREDTIQKAINAVKKDDPLRKIQKEEKILLHEVWEMAVVPFCIIALAIFMLWISTITGTDIIVIFYAMLPSIITLVLVALLVFMIPKTYKLGLFAFPLLTSMGFYYLALNGYIAALVGTEFKYITFLNLLASSMITFLIISAKVSDRSIFRKEETYVSEKKILPKPRLYRLGKKNKA